MEGMGFEVSYLLQFFYGATWSLSRMTLFNWYDEQAGDFEALVKTFVSLRRVLRVLTDSILFTRKDKERSCCALIRWGAIEWVTRRVQPEDEANIRLAYTGAG